MELFYPSGERKYIGDLLLGHEINYLAPHETHVLMFTLKYSLQETASPTLMPTASQDEYDVNGKKEGSTNVYTGLVMKWSK